MESSQLAQLLHESTALEPILLINTSGYDPSTEIRDLALTKVGLDKYIEVQLNLSITFDHFYIDKYIGIDGGGT